MPYEQMDEKQVAAYLHMDLRDLLKLSARGEIPCRKIGGRFVYMKGEVDHWVESQMSELDKTRLAGIEKGVSAHHGFEAERMLVSKMIPEEAISVPLVAKTRDAVIRSLVDLAERSQLVYCRDELIREVLNRERMCSTALVPGVAIPHPRHPLPYDIAAGFIVVGLTASGVPFGAEDGSLTRLFFLVCCKDERTHLHVLARLARMLHEQQDIDALLRCQSSQELRDRLVGLEERVIAR